MYVGGGITLTLKEIEKIELAFKNNDISYEDAAVIYDNKPWLTSEWKEKREEAC